MKDNDFRASISKLIQAEKDFKARCANFNAEAMNAESSKALQSIIKSKDECIFDLSKILELLS